MKSVSSRFEPEPTLLREVVASRDQDRAAISDHGDTTG